MAQITWRNVDPANTATNAAAIQRDSTALADSLKSLGAFTTGIGEKRKDVNTEALLRQIQGLDTAGLEAARTSGQFGAEALEGQNVDTGALFSALKGQDAAIESDLTARLGRENAALGRSEAPEIQAIKNKIAAGDYAGAQSDIETSGIRDKTGLTTAVKSGERAAEMRTRADDAHADQQAAKERDRVNREQLEDSSNLITKSMAGRASTIAGNKSAMEQTAEEYGLTLDDTGNFIFPELEVAPKHLSTRGQADLNKNFVSRHERLQNKVARRAKELGLTENLTPVQRKKKLSAGLLELGLDANEYRTAVSNFDEVQGLANDLPSGAKTALDQKNAEDLGTEQVRMEVLNSEHAELVAANPLTPEETKKRETMSLNEVLVNSVKIAAQGSYLPDGWSDDGVGGEDLRDLINDTYNKTIDYDIPKLDASGKPMKDEAGKPITEAVSRKPEPWMLDTALLIAGQTAEESWGNPVVFEAAFKEIVKQLASDVTQDYRKEVIKLSKAKLDKAKIQFVKKQGNIIKQNTLQAAKNAGTYVFDPSAILSRAAKRNK